MDFFQSLWKDPEQTQVPSSVNFAADITAEKWINHSSTYKLISGTLKHPHVWLGVDKYFNDVTTKKSKLLLDSASSWQRPAYERKERKPTMKNTNETHDGENKTDEDSEGDAESSGESSLFQKFGYVPGLRKNPVLHKMSCLDTREHAECLHLFQKFSKFTGNVIMPSDRSEHFKFEVMYKKVQDEQKEFCQNALSQWPERAKDTQKVSDVHMRPLQLFWMIKANKALEHYPHFYKQRLLVPLHSGDIKVQMVKLSDLLQMGTIPAFFQPPRTKRTKPSTAVSKLLQATDYNFGSDQVVGSLHKLPVSADPNAESLARLHKAHIVISSGALSKLVETHFNFSKEWTLPISVKEYRTIDKGKTMVKTIVFIDKPLPKQSMTAEECHRFVVKHGLKRILLAPHGKSCFTFPIPGVDPLPKETAATPEKASEVSSVEGADPEPGHSAPGKNEKERVEDDNRDANLKEDTSDHSEDEKLVIAESSTHATNEQNDRKKRSVAEASSCKVPANATVAPAKSTKAAGAHCKTREPFQRKDGLKLPKTPDGFTAPLSNTNVTYSSWVIGPENVEQASVHQKKALKELSVIVRCRVDACEKVAGDVTAFSLSPKVEYQLGFAGEEATKEELAREWASLHFKPAFHVQRVRVDHDGCEIVMFEKMDKSQIVADAQRMHGIRLSDSLQTLYSVFSEVSTLTKGSYLLHHSSRDNAFASLEQSVENAQENNQSVRNLEEYFSQKLSVACDPNPPWRKLDCTLLLPRHEVLQLMPATYRPKPCGKAFIARNILSLKPKREGKKGSGFPQKTKKKNCQKKNRNRRKNKQNQNKED